MYNLQAYLTEFLAKYIPFLSEKAWLLDGIVDAILLTALLVVTWLVYIICFHFIYRYLIRLIKKSHFSWDNEFIESRMIKRMTRFIPALVLWHWAPEVLRKDLPSKIAEIVFTIVLIIVGLTVLYSALNTFHRLYQRNKISREVPIDGITQIIKIILGIAAGILILSAILGKSPALIFSGFGALTAILMLVFKDPLLGLTAGIQLCSNRLIAVGDWIEVPKYEANGTVLEMGLTTVKVQNWDKTITTIPTYSLISESFKNWQGMSESGLRRIKRSLFIDMKTIRFLEEGEIKALKENPLLKDYLDAKLQELNKDDPAYPQAERRLTNLGTFRAYTYAYLRAHGNISSDGTQLVRQLQPSSQGLPIEIYCFSNDNNWCSYEDIQGDIFDHLIAILPSFHLHLYQQPTGADFQKL